MKTMIKYIYLLLCLISINCYAMNTLPSSTNKLKLPTPPDNCLHIASNSELTELRTSSYPLNDFNPGVSDEDLAPLNSIIGTATVVGLGEGSHGTHEFFKMKHRLIEYLVKHMGFTIFSIEANMPEAYKLNDYVLNGKGDPKELIAGMYFWTWNTQEVYELVQWMRNYNMTAKIKVQFTGFDMQIPNMAADIVITDLTSAGYSSIAEDIKQILPDLLAFTQLYPEDRERLSKTPRYQSVLKIITDLQHTLHTEAPILNKILGKNEYAWLQQNVNILQQSYTTISYGDRDKYMAQNVLWIQHQNPEAKILLWAHNGHVTKRDTLDDKRMGGYLARKLKDNYRVIATTTFEGQYTAIGINGGLHRDLILEDAPEGVLESNLKKLSKPILLINMRHIASEGLPNFMLHETCWRSVMAMQMPNSFMYENLSTDFDAIIDIQKTTASQAIT